MQKSAAKGSQGTGVAVGEGEGKGEGGKTIGVEVCGAAANGIEVTVGTASAAAGPAVGAQEARRRHVIASGVKTPRSNLLVKMSNPTTLLHHGFDLRFKFIRLGFQLGEFGEHPLPRRLVLE